MWWGGAVCSVLQGVSGVDKRDREREREREITNKLLSNI